MSQSIPTVAWVESFFQDTVSKPFNLASTLTVGKSTSIGKVTLVDSSGNSTTIQPNPTLSRGGLQSSGNFDVSGVFRCSSVSSPLLLKGTNYISTEGGVGNSTLNIGNGSLMRLFDPSGYGYAQMSCKRDIDAVPVTSYAVTSVEPNTTFNIEFNYTGGIITTKTTPNQKSRLEIACGIQGDTSLCNASAGGSGGFYFYNKSDTRTLSTMAIFRPNTVSSGLVLPQFTFGPVAYGYIGYSTTAATLFCPIAGVTLVCTDPPSGVFTITVTDSSSTYSVGVATATLEAMTTGQYARSISVQAISYATNSMTVQFQLFQLDSNGALGAPLLPTGIHFQINAKTY